MTAFRSPNFTSSNDQLQVIFIFVSPKAKHWNETRAAVIRHPRGVSGVLPPHVAVADGNFIGIDRDVWTEACINVNYGPTELMRDLGSSIRMEFYFNTEYYRRMRKFLWGQNVCYSIATRSPLLYNRLLTDPRESSIEFEAGLFAVGMGRGGRGTCRRPQALHFEPYICALSPQSPSPP